MPAAYVTTFNKSEIERHAALADQLDKNHPVKVEATPLADKRWQVTIVGYDYIGQLSLICGLLFVYGFNIVDGDVFSYGPSETNSSGRGSLERGSSERGAVHSSRKGPRAKKAIAQQQWYNRRKIVDVFTVRSVSDQINDNCWDDYMKDLTVFARLLHADKQREAQGELAKRVAVTVRHMTGSATTLYPVDIEIDNDASERHTVLRIDAPDTMGFLYEFTNALALNGINIRRVAVDSIGDQAQDILYVTDAQRQKITKAEKQRELRIATALIKHFTHLLPQSPNPELALLHFREFVGQLFTMTDWPAELTSLERPEVLKTLARLLGGQRLFVG